MRNPKLSHETLQLLTVIEVLSKAFFNSNVIYLVGVFGKSIESLNMTLRKIIKSGTMFSSAETVFKILYLALKNISKKRTMPVKNQSGAMNQFAILFENRLPKGDYQNNSFTEIF